MGWWLKLVRVVVVRDQMMLVREAQMGPRNGKPGRIQLVFEVLRQVQAG